MRLTEPEEAPPEIQEIYSQLRSALGLPYVGTLYRAYGTCPEFLKRHWAISESMVRTKRFFEVADRLRADAYTRAHNYLSVPNLSEELSEVKVSTASLAEIKDCVELFHRSSSYFLLLCAWQLRAFEGPVGKRDRGEPAAPPKVEATPMIIKDEVMTAETKKCLDAIRRATEAPALDLFYVAIARWQDLLHDFWEGLHAEMGSALYEHCKREVQQCSFQLLDDLPGPLELTTLELMDTVDEGELGSIVRITETFHRSLSALVLNVAWTRIALEGGTKKRKRTPKTTAVHETPRVA